MKKYKPKFKLVEALKLPHVDNEEDAWVVKFGDIKYVFPEESFNKLFEEASECDSHPNWSKSIAKTAEPCVMELIFSDSNKNQVFNILNELQFNIYPSADILGRPIIVVPKDGYEMKIPINSFILIEDGVVKSFKPISQEDKDGSI